VTPSAPDSESRYRAIFDRAAIGISVVDEHGVIVEANTAFQAFLGYRIDELVGRPSSELSPPAEAAITSEALRELQNGDEPSVTCEQQFRRKDGTLRTASLTLSRVQLGDGRPGYIGMTSDVTEQRAADRARAQQSAFVAAVLEDLYDGVVACDAQGKLTLFNRALREMHGLPAADLPRDEWSNHYALFHGDGVTPLAMEDIPLLRAFRGEIVQDSPIVIAPRGGVARTLLANGRRFTDANGEPLGAVVVMRDVTAQSQAELALRESENRYGDLLDTLPLVVYVVEARAPYAPVYVSPGVSLLGYTHEEWMARPDSWTRALHPQDRERVLAETTAALEAGRPVEYEYRMIAKDGSTRWVHDRGDFVNDSDGKPATWRGIMIDVTGRREAERDLAHERGFLAAVLDSLSEGIIACDRFGKLTLVNRATRELHGLPAEGFVPPEQWGRNYNTYRPESHPEAGSPMPQDELPLLRALRSRASVQGVEFQVAPAGRAPRTMVANARVIRGASGEFLGAVSASRDMTEQKETEKALRQSEARVRGSVEASLDAMFICRTVRDIAGEVLDFECTDANARAAALVGVPEAEMIGRLASDIVPSLRTERLLLAFSRVVETGEAFERELQPVDERIEAQWIRLQAVRVNDGIGVTVRDISDQKKAEETLRALALVDELTGVHNRRGFMALAEREWQRAQREQRGAVLAYIDLDDFKGVNDVHGHAEGDAALQCVADILRAAFRGADVIGRLGGDEFAVLVVPTGPASGDIVEVERRIVERIRYHLQSSNTVSRAIGRRYDLSMSIGTAVVSLVSSTAEGSPSLASLIVMADERLYEQKRMRTEAAVTPADPETLTPCGT